MSYNINLQHIVFRTYRSRQTIPADEKKRQLLGYIHNDCKRLQVGVYRLNAHLNHVHLLVDIGVNLSIAEFMKIIKSNSSRFLKGNPNFPFFEGWARRYGSFSVSRWDKDKIYEYIKNQEEHHKRLSFAEEVAELFGVDITRDKWWRQEWLDEGATD